MPAIQTVSPQPIVAMDIGSTKIIVLVASAGSSRRLLGVGVAPSQGVHKGAVVDPAAATRAVQLALTRAEQMAGGKVQTAWLAVGGNHLSVVPGSAEHDGPLGEVTSGLMERLQAEARNIYLQSDRQAFSWQVQGWTVDGTPGVRDPKGMLAAQVAVHGTLVTAGAGPTGNLVRVAEGAGVEIVGHLSVPEAVGELLTAEERQGAIVLDLGGQTTHVGLFQRGVLTHLTCLAVGGDHLTRDLSLALHLPLAAAEQVKQRYGFASPGFARDRSLSAVFPGGNRMINELQVARVIESRLREMLALLLHETRARGGFDLPQQLVITGGGAGLGGLSSYLNELLGLPVRVGTSPAWMQQGGVADPAFAVAAGLLRRAMMHLPEAAPPAGPETFWQRLQKVLRTVARRKQRSV